MPHLGILVQDESGEQLAFDDDSHGLLLDAIQACGDERVVLLRGIDEYGRAVFNRIQMARFLLELEIVATASAADPRTSALIASVRSLAERVHDEVHTFLVFEGD